MDFVGRAIEIDQLDRFLAGLVATPPTPAALVLEGPAGIGKSTLWSAALERARSRGMLVLLARPSEAEATFAFQALADLLEALQPEIQALPAPQRRSLGVALLREELESGETIDPHAVAVATANVIRSAAYRRPLVIAVDDAPWLDRASASVLTFVIRRLAGRAVGVMLSQRVDRQGDAPLDLERDVPTQRLWLGPFGRSELHLLLAARLGLVLPRATLARLHEQSAGNPLHALEIGRALQRLPALPRPGEPLPVPASMRALIDRRLDVLSADARELLVLAAVAGTPSVSVVLTAFGHESGAEAALEEAEGAGLITIDGPAIRFSHPLIASTIVAKTGGPARRAAHRALAVAVGEPEARARHLAIAATKPDRRVAETLETAAREADQRGASETAVELLRLAIDATADSALEDLGRRRLRLGTTLLKLADLAAASVALDLVIATQTPGPLLAEALLARSTVAWYVDGERRAASYLERALQALEVAPDGMAADSAGLEPAELLGRIHLRLGQFEEDMRVAKRHRLEAVRLLERTSARASYATALIRLFNVDVSLGQAPDESLLERGLELEDPGDPDATTLPGLWWLNTDRPELARERFKRMQSTGHDLGKWSGDADLLTQSALAEIYADDWSRARALIDEALIAAAQEGQHDPVPAIRMGALLDAHEGRLDDGQAEALADRAFEAGSITVGISVLHAMTLAAAARADHQRVDQLTGRALEWMRAIDWVEPLRIDPTPERIEALIGLARLDEAEALLDGLERRARTVPRRWADAAVARGRSLLLAARGDPAGAVAATDPAMDARSAEWRSFDRARTQLVRGQILRGLRRPREAGQALDAALATFDRLGARVWAARARSEMGRLGRRRPGRDDLTPSEREVAALAASGLRNHEVASRLGVSPKTVEAHLARAYAKLGIRSRAELGRVIAADVEAEPPP